MSSYRTAFVLIQGKGKDGESTQTWPINYMEYLDDVKKKNLFSAFFDELNRSIL